MPADVTWQATAPLTFLPANLGSCPMGTSCSLACILAPSWSSHFSMSPLHTRTHTALYILLLQPVRQEVHGSRCLRPPTLLDALQWCLCTL